VSDEEAVLGTLFDSREVNGHDARLVSVAALSQGIGSFIVGKSVALEEGTQGLGVGRLAQPDQGFCVQLADALVAQAKTSAKLTIAGRHIAAQAIVGNNHLLQALGQTVHRAAQRLLQSCGISQGRRIIGEEVQR